MQLQFSAVRVKFFFHFMLHYDLTKIQDNFFFLCINAKYIRQAIMLVCLSVANMSNSAMTF